MNNEYSKWSDKNWDKIEWKVPEVKFEYETRMTKIRPSLGVRIGCQAYRLAHAVKNGFMRLYDGLMSIIWCKEVNDCYEEIRKLKEEIAVLQVKNHLLVEEAQTYKTLMEQGCMMVKDGASLFSVLDELNKEPSKSPIKAKWKPSKAKTAKKRRK